MNLEQKEPYPPDSTTVKYSLKENGAPRNRSWTLSTITAEPMVVCYILGMVLIAMATQNLNLEKTCKVNLKLNESVCNAIKSRDASGYNKSYEVEVQKYVAETYIWKFVLQSTSSVIILAFVGSWIDRSGKRKACLVAPLIAELCSVSCLMACVYFFYQLPMQFNIVSEAIGFCLAGGLNVFMVGVFTIICDKTTEEERTVRVGIVHALLQGGLTTGLALSGILLRRIGFFGVYGVAFALYLLAALYGMFFIKNSETSQKLAQRKVGFFRDFFDMKNLKHTFKVTLVNEDKLKQKRIRLMLIVAMLVVGPSHGEMGVIYLYTRYKYHWDEADFGVFFSFCAVVHFAAATASLLIFSKLLKMDDALLGCIAAVSKIAGSIMFAFAPTGRIFYAGICADVLSSILFITMRSIITKQVTPAGLGKMNSVFGVAEAIVPLFYGPVYSATYKATITIFPGTFFIISAALTIPVFAIYVWLYTNRTKKVEEEPEYVEKLEKLLVH